MTMNKESTSEYRVQRAVIPSSDTTARRTLTEVRAVLEDVKPLVRMGASVIRLHELSKRPVGEDWSKMPRLKMPELQAQYRKGENVGVRLGKWSEIEGMYLHVFDVDIRIEDEGDEALDTFEKLLPGVDVWNLHRVQSGSGGKSQHFYFVTDAPFPSRKLAHSGKKLVDAKGKQHWTWEIELFGTGKQVALPPSVHPDTGREYRWIDPVDEIDGFRHIPGKLLDNLVSPVTDEELHETEKLGCTYEEVEAALKHLDLDYWCEDREGWIRLGMALHHEYDGDKEAFEVWCDYSRKSQKFDRAIQWQQWKSFKKSPEKPVRMATVFKAANETRRDAEFRALPGEFDDIEDEITASADDVEDVAEPAITATADDFEDIAPTTKAMAGKVTVKGIPDHLLRVPGVLQKLVDYYNATAIRPQPQLAVQTALAIGSVVCGRMWDTGEENNYTSLYFMNVAPTAAGKEHARKVIGRTLDASRLNSLMGPKGYASEPAIIGRLKRQPKHITVTDEMGRYIGSARKAGNGNKLDAQTLLMEIFGNVDDVLRGISYSTRGMTEDQITEMMNTEITRPALTLVGMTTPATLYEAIGGMDVKDGFLNRFIIVQSEIGRQKRRRGLTTPDIPREVITWAKEHAFAHGGTEDENDLILVNPKFVPPPVEVPFSKAAIAMLSEIEDEVDAEITKAEAYGMGELYGRTQEIAQRLSLIIARSERSDRVEVDHLQWAWDYVRFYHRQMVNMFKDNLGKSEHEAIAEEVFTFLKKQGGEGAVPSEIARYCRAFRALDTRGRDEILVRVQSDMGVRHTVHEGKGHKTKRYFAPKR